MSAPSAGDTSAPLIFVVSSSTGTSTASVSWVTTEHANSQVAYGTTTSYGSTNTLDTGLVFFHSMTLTGLTPATTYHFQVRSRDAAGNLATSSDHTFTTDAAPDTAAPILSSIGTSAVGSTSATVAWTTTESSTSKVYYTSASVLSLGSASTTSNGALVTSHSLPLTGLTASTTYLFKVESADALGNTALSATSSFATGL